MLADQLRARYDTLNHQRARAPSLHPLVELVGKALISIDVTKKMNRKNARVYTMMLFGMMNCTYTWYDAKGPIKPKEFAQLAMVFPRGS